MRQGEPVKRKILTLTEKQVARILDSLRSTETLRAKEKEREYLRKIAKTIREQTV